MNIKSRINKLEKQTGTKSVFCVCKQTIKNEIYRQDLTSDGETTEPQLMSNPVPDICQLCKRKVEKSVFIIRLVESGIPKPEMNY